MAANSNIMVIGAAGQIGTDLTPALRKRHDREAVIAVCRQTKPAAEVLDGGPCEFIDATDKKQLGALIDRYRVGTIYHLAAIMMLFEATFDAYLEQRAVVMVVVRQQADPPALTNPLYSARSDVAVADMA